MGSKSNKNVLLITQEIKLARSLADNNKTTRDRALKHLKRWMFESFKVLALQEDDLLRIWKGLFYSMWSSDKLLVQEECAENIAGLIHQPTPQSSMMFFKCALITLINHWFGIDQLRLDKFLMLVRRLLRQALLVVKKEHWSREAVERFCDAISSTVLNETIAICCLGLKLHFIEIYLEEVAKVSEGALKRDTVLSLIKPFIGNLAVVSEPRQRRHIQKFIFLYLVKQSDMGLEYSEKYEVWKQVGFPGSIDSIKKVPLAGEDDAEMLDDEEDTHYKPLDPRAGRVDVELPQLKFNPRRVTDALLDARFRPETNTKSRKVLHHVAQLFQKMAEGVYPLGATRLALPTDTYDTNVRKAVNRLVKFEKKIAGGQNQRGPKLSKAGNTETVKRNFSKCDTCQVVPNKKMKMLSNGLNGAGDLDFVVERNSGVWYVFDTSKAKPHSVGSTHQDTVSDPYQSYAQSDEAKILKDARRTLRNSWELSLLKEGEQPVKHSQAVNAALKKSQHNKKVSKLNSPQSVQQLEEYTHHSDVVANLFNICKSNDAKSAKTHRAGVQNVSDVQTRNILKVIKGKHKRSSLPVGESSSGQCNVTGKKRKSSDSGMPPTIPQSTPVKRVKINTKLNKSQEIHEHIAGVLKSPSIPYDANKKPDKSLLKPTCVASPINPFYKHT